MKPANNQPAVLHAPESLSALEKTLLNDFQRGLPLCAEPFAEMARQAGVREDEVISTLASLQQRGMISRVGPVFAPRRVGASTLAAMAVPFAELESVAAIVSGFPEVNHNYQREHAFNLWFVVTAPEQALVEKALADIEAATGLPVLDLPLEHSFYIDLGFPLWC